MFLLILKRYCCSTWSRLDVTFEIWYLFEIFDAPLKYSCISDTMKLKWRHFPTHNINVHWQLYWINKSPLFDHIWIHKHHSVFVISLLLLFDFFDNMRNLLLVVLVRYVKLKSEEFVLEWHQHVDSVWLIKSLGLKCNN